MSLPFPSVSERTKGNKYRKTSLAAMSVISFFLLCPYTIFRVLFSLSVAIFLSFGPQELRENRENKENGVGRWDYMGLPFFP
jgi:hypothetical protein